MTDDALYRVLESVADREHVDWDSLEREAGGNEDREWLHWVHVLEKVAGAYLPLPDENTAAEGAAADGADGASTASPRSGPIAPMDASIEERWGKYILRQKVGEGGFGSVYRAWDPDLELEVAIKVLHRRVEDTELRQALLQEGRALARIKHPNVVRVLSVESHQDQIALRMEFVHGETLEDVLKRHGTLNAREATLVGEDVCRALAAVHQAGFVHRDVKARNVMREQAGRIVLMDFGAGRHSDDLKIPGKVTTMGTPLYMAPEVLAGDLAAPTSDVYSVGVLLYYLVTGQYPVEGRSLDDIRRAHMQNRRRGLTERRADLPTSFTRVVEKALAPDVDRRYANAGALVAELAGISTTSDGVRTLGRWASVAALGVAGVLAAGLVTNAAWDVTLGRVAPFSERPFTENFEMGLRSLVTPVVAGSGMFLAAWVLRFYVHEFFRAARGSWLARRFHAISSLASSLRLDEPAGLAYAVTIVGVVLTGVVVWTYRDLLAACTTPALLNSAPEMLARVEPGHLGRFYRLSLDALMVVYILTLVRLRRLLGGGGASRVTVMAPVVGVLAFTLLLSVGPWRILWRNRVERVEVAGERCYVLGEAESQAQVYCPDRPPPRTRVIRLSDPSVERTGLFESLFTPAADAARKDAQ